MIKSFQEENSVITKKKITKYLKKLTYLGALTHLWGIKQFFLQPCKHGKVFGRSSDIFG